MPGLLGLAYWRAHRPGVLGILDEVPSIEKFILHRLQGAQPQGPHLLLHSSTQPLQHLDHRGRSVKCPKSGLRVLLVPS